MRVYKMDQDQDRKEFFQYFNKVVGKKMYDLIRVEGHTKFASIEREFYLTEISYLDREELHNMVCYIADVSSEVEVNMFILGKLCIIGRK